MADSTINYGFPYPTGGDRVAVHSDIEKVAKAADATVKTVEGDVGNLAGRVATTEADIADIRANPVAVTYVGDGVYEIG